jgi:hypothetical protein
MKFQTLGIALVAALAMTGCKKTESGNDASAAAAAIAAASGAGDTSTPAGMMAEAARKADADAKLAALPKADLAKSLTDYAKVDSGVQLMFLYLAASKLPPDYDSIASSFSADYRGTSDTFRKHDLMAALKPQIDARIAAATQQPYGWEEVDDSSNLSAYDFQRKGFPVGEFSQTMTRYFNDASDYRVEWANREALAFAPVNDEAVAREIETMRTKYDQSPRLRVYYFAQSVDLGSKTIKAFVTRVQITDSHGRVLAEYGPH